MVVDRREIRDDGSRGCRNRKDGSVGSGKKTIPFFYGTSDPNEYIDWEERMEYIFKSQNYSESMKVRRACSEFTSDALTWWNKLAVIRRKCGDGSVSTWDELKIVMRKRYAPNHHDMRSGRRDLYEEFCASMTRPRKREKSVVSPVSDSRTKAIQHEYQGTRNLSNSRTRDICLWCLESGHDIRDCPKEDVKVVEKKVEVVGEPKLEVEIVGEPESHVEIEEVEEFMVVDERVELVAVVGKSLDGEEVHDVFVEEDEHVNDASDEFVETLSIHIVQESPKDDLDNQKKRE